jgi:diguanylate cyclase (GGDEF)-like protein/PAS domain S-box-containing protein
MMAAWVVVIEAVGPSAISIGAVRRLMELMAHTNPTTLYSPDRYALQVVIRAPSADEALTSALALWRDGQEQLNLGGWELARAEVISAAEFERDTASRSRAATPASAGSEEGELEELLLRQAYHDPLTGLASRELFLDHLQHALRRCDRADTRLALLLFEVDEYHATRDCPGDEFRDAVLATVADRLMQGIRPGDSVGRVGESLFGVVLEHVSELSAFITGTRLLDALLAPMTVGGNEVVVPTGLGLAANEPGYEADELLAAAETSLRRGEEIDPQGRHLFAPHLLSQEHHPLRTRAVEHRDGLAHLRLLQASAVASSECTTLESAARMVLQQVCAQLGWPLGHLLVVSSEAHCRLVPSGVWNAQAPERFRPFQEEMGSSPHAGCAGLPDLVLTEGEPRWASYVGADAHLVEAEAAAGVGLMAGFAVPVLVQKEVVAVLQFFTADATAPGNSVHDVLATVGMQLGRVIERDRATTAEAGTRAHLRALAGSVTEAMVWVEADGTVASWLGGAQRIFGYSEAEALSLRLSDLLPDVFDPIPLDAERMLETLVNRRIVGEAVRRDGSGFSAELTLLNWESSDTRLFTAVIRELVEEHHGEGEVRRQEALLRALLRNSSDMVTVLEPDGTLRQHFGQRVLGYPEGSKAGRPIWELVHPDDRDRALRAFAQLLAKPGLPPRQLELRVLHADGSWRWIEVIGTNLMEHPVVGGLVLNSRDMTERRAAERALLESQELLAELHALAGSPQGWTARIPAAPSAPEHAEGPLDGEGLDV